MFRVKRITVFIISFSALFVISNKPFVTSSNFDGVSLWITKLRDKDENVRRRAAYALKEIGPDPKAAVTELVKGLKDNDPYVRRYCAAALGELRLESDLAVPALMEALADTDQKVCAHAAVALAKIGSPAVPALVKALDRVDIPAASGRDIPQKDKNKVRTQVRVLDYAAFALSEIGPTAIPALIRSRSNRRYRITEYADYVIEQNYESDKNVIPSLIQLLSENDRSILLSTIDLIGRIGPNAAAAAPQLVNIVKVGEPALCQRAATALGSIGALPEILPLLSDQNDKIRALGVTAIAELNTSGASGEETKIESLGRAVVDPNVNVRRAAIRSLESLGPSEYRDRETQKSFLAIMPVFISALRDKDNEVRQTAVMLISGLGVEARPAVPHLIETIHDRVRNVRIEAIKALGLIGTTARPAIPALIRMLGAADAEHRSRIASTIGAIGAGDGATVAILIKLLNDPSPEARHAAVIGLAKLGLAAKPAIPALMNKLNTSEVKLRSEIVSAIGVIGAGDDRTVAILTRLLKDPSGAVRQSAFQSLGRLGPQASAAMPQLIDALKRGRLIRNQLDLYSYDASSALAEIGPSSIAPLLEVLRDRDSDIRAEVIQIFSMMELLPVEALLQALRSPYEDVRVAAIEVFGAAVPNDKSIVTALIAGLKDSDGEARRSAATALGQYGLTAQAAEPELIPLLSDEDSEVRKAAAIALAGIGRGDGAVPVLIDLLKQDHGVASTLKRVGAPAIPAIIELLNDSRPSIRRISVSLLAEFGQQAKNAVPSLIQLLKDSDAEVRKEAARALGKIGPDAITAATTLVAALEDQSASVQIAAAEALFCIGYDLKQAGPMLITVINDAFIADYVENTLDDIIVRVRPSPHNPVRISAGRPPNLPPFPWPLPRPTRYDVMRDGALGTDKSNLGEAFSGLIGVLKSAGFDESGIFTIPEGYAVATRVERIQENGVSMLGEDRWSKGKIPLRTLNPLKLLGSYFFEPPGQWRSFTFLITKRDNIARSDKPLSEDEARNLSLIGGRVLPEDLASLAYKGYKCHVFVYQFEKKLGEGALPRTESPWSVAEQLKLAGISLPF